MEHELLGRYTVVVEIIRSLVKSFMSTQWLQKELTHALIF